MRIPTPILVSTAALLLAACTTTTPSPAPVAAPQEAAEESTMTTAEATPAPPAAPAAPTAEEAAQFVNEAEARLAAINVDANRASWVQSTYISYDTQILSAKENEKLINAGVELAKRAARYDGLELPYDVRRKLETIKLSLTSPGPADPALTAEMTRIASDLEAAYGAGKFCPPGKSGDDCLDVNEITNIMRTSRDPKKLLEAWEGWHTISPPMRDKYTRFVELMNQGSRDLGYPDVGAMWRSKYDMPPDAFATEVDRLWNQVKPLYDSVHCFVRAGLNKKYGDKVVPLDQPIPAHLLGNIWAQEWGNVYDLVAPPKADRGYDLTKILEKRKEIDEIEMVKIGERFFTSLGFAPLPETFWERSMFTKPRDREVVCHASAWDVDDVDDLRIKMCIEKNADDFNTIHHELGHNFYQRAYKDQPFLYKNSANDGFHEAVGDTIALSVTPAYLVKIGFLDKEPPASADIPLLLRDALDKIAFFPFGILMDKWRWGVFSGQITPANYNKAWWDLRRQYQGIAPAGDRGEQYFDPGAKYHIPANVPYARYFLARILQFQFHRSLCQQAGYKGPLNRCSIYDNKEAGARLDKMLSMGMSRPWPDALEALTGQREMDATAVVDYFRPLLDWLETQNKGKQCGW
ncbi:MAG TPA: M2 family metallopeptidase [Thermoanaerobaculia bacterium]|jgi:peptidyl-dipeptidase A|nr:M2 family metallopeptidase [Thermoanaerobaculia bacterium]